MLTGLKNRIGWSAGALGVLLLAAVVGGTVQVPVAAAAVVQPAPIGDTTVDPIVQLGQGIGTPGGYSPAEIESIVQRVAGTDTSAGGQPARDYLVQWLGGPDTALIDGESDDAATQARALPAWPSYINVFPNPGSGDSGDTFKRHITRPDASTADVYVNFISRYIGGAQIETPTSFTLGTDYKFFTTSTTDTPGRFTGWKYLDPATVTSAGFDTSKTGTDGIWVFQTATEIAHAYGIPGSYPSWYGAGGNYSVPGFYPGNNMTGNSPALPTYADCVSSNVLLGSSGCYDVSEAQYMAKPGVAAAVAQGMDQTFRNLDGVNTPLVAHLDTDVYASGHAEPSAPQKLCGTFGLAAGLVRCMLVYTRTVPPHTTTATKPAATTDQGTTNYTQPTPTDTDRGKIVTYINNHPCFGAAFKALAQPNKYAYYGCDVTINVTNNTYTTTETPAATTLTMPNCVGGAVSSCQAALAAGGYVGTLSSSAVGGWDADPAKAASAILTQSMAAGASIDKSQALSVTTNPAVMPFALVSPQPNETYAAYIARLQALGYVGTATESDLTTPEAGYGPGSPVRVTYTNTATGVTTTLDPNQWPSTAPYVPVDVALTVTVNPAGAVPVPTQGNPGAIDWSPLQNLNLGSKFPFGSITWMQSAVGPLAGTGTCPTLTIPWPDQLGVGHTDMRFCSAAWENDYRPWVFPVLEALMTIALIAFIGMKIVGLNDGGSAE